MNDLQSEILDKHLKDVPPHLIKIDKIEHQIRKGLTCKIPALKVELEAARLDYQECNRKFDTGYKKAMLS